MIPQCTSIRTDVEPIDQDDREGWITKDVCDDSAQNGRCRQTSECKHVVNFLERRTIGMNGRSCLVRDNKTIKNNSLSTLILNPSIARRIH